MQINLNEKILIAANRLLRLRHVSQFEADFMPLIKSAKEALAEVEAHLTKRAADGAKSAPKKSSSKAVKRVQSRRH